jgi:hypothetical protein
MLGKALAVGRDTIGILVGRARGLAALVGTQVVGPLARGIGGDEAGGASGGAGVGAGDGGAGDTMGTFKYVLGVPPPAGAVRPGATGLPTTGGPARAVLMVRDPWCLFAWWEAPPEAAARARESLGPEARSVLRVHDVTFIAFSGDNAWLSFDVELPPGADRWYVDVPRPAASYCVEVGLRAPDGRFVALARSNVARAPRPSPSPDTTVAWCELARPAASGAAGFGSPAGRETAGHGGEGTRLD